MTNYIHLFIQSPAAIVATLSFIIAYVTYLYQRRRDRKQKSVQIAKWYAEYVIPKNSYLVKILELIGNTYYSDKFSNIKTFTSNELSELLKQNNCTPKKFIENFNKLTIEMLDEAFCFCGCNENIAPLHDNIKTYLSTIKNTNNEILIYEIINRVFVHFLNELETIALQFNCNLAEDKLVYPILHQTFIRNMKNWYYFIAKENQFDQNRYYPNLIVLYKSWLKRSNQYEIKYYKLVEQKNRTKRI